MSDRIKKIKVKKADGSMTDYIPIGVDAENVDFDNGYKLDNIVGSINPDESGSIATQLSKSIKYYDCVADMKADTTLNGGGAARTLGYYKPGDGGGAIYRIVETSNQYYENLDNNLKAELIINESITPEMFGAYGDNIHDDSLAFQNAILTNKKVKLSNKTYIINYCVTKMASSIILIGNNTTIRSNKISTDDYGHDYYGIITDDDLEQTSYYNGGEVIIKNINFNGNANNITSWKYKGFGFINIYNRKNVNIENCQFENITNDAISIAGLQNKAYIKNCKFNSIGLYEPTGDARRNAISCSTHYFDRATGTVIYSDKNTGLYVDDCEFKDIADECVSPRYLTNVSFTNNICSNIGQRVIESGNNHNNSEYTVNIENCKLNNIAECMYTNGEDGGKSNPYKGIITINNVKATNMAWTGSTALVKRPCSTQLINTHNDDSTKEPDVIIKNSYFESITAKENLTNKHTANFIVANKITIENTKFKYPYLEFNYMLIPQDSLIMNNSEFEIDETMSGKYIFLRNKNKLIMKDITFNSANSIYMLIQIHNKNTNIVIDNLNIGEYYAIVSFMEESELENTNISIKNSILGTCSARPIMTIDNATTKLNKIICSHNIFGHIQYGNIFNGNATFKSIINNNNYNITTS